MKDKRLGYLAMEALLHNLAIEGDAQRAKRRLQVLDELGFVKPYVDTLVAHAGPSNTNDVQQRLEALGSLGYRVVNAYLAVERKVGRRVA